MIGRRFVIAGLPLLAACGGILPKPAPPPMLYRLTPLPEATPQAATLDVALVVEMPSAPESLDTARIALTRGAFGFDYFANAAWTDRAPALLQTLIIESLQSRIRVVTGTVGQVRADAVLATSLRRFEAAYGGSDASIAQIQFDAVLVRASDRGVLAVRRFAGSAPAAANDMTAIVASFDTSLHAALADLLAAVADALGGRR